MSITSMISALGICSILIVACSPSAGNMSQDDQELNSLQDTSSTVVTIEQDVIENTDLQEFDQEMRLASSLEKDNEGIYTLERGNFQFELNFKSDQSSETIKLKPMHSRELLVQLMDATLSFDMATSTGHVIASGQKSFMNTMSEGAFMTVTVRRSGTVNKELNSILYISVL